MDAQKMTIYRNPPLYPGISEESSIGSKTTDSLRHLFIKGMFFAVRMLWMTRMTMNNESMPWRMNDGTKTIQNCDGGGSEQKDRPLLGMLTRLECSWLNCRTRTAIDPAVHQKNAARRVYLAVLLF